MGEAEMWSGQTTVGVSPRSDLGQRYRSGQKSSVNLTMIRGLGDGNESTPMFAGEPVRSYS